MLPSVDPTGHVPEEEHREAFTEPWAWKAERLQLKSAPSTQRGAALQGLV